MTTKLNLALGSMVLVAALVACGAGDGQGRSTFTRCTPGETKACACSVSQSGVKVCGDDERWKSCQCSPVTTDTVGGDSADDVQACAPDCAGKVCGFDGCNGTCGTCGATQGCDDQGQCVEIIADVIEPDVTEPDLNAPDVPEPDVATEDVPVVADTPLPDSPPPLDPGIDPGTDPGTATDVAFSDCPARDSTATDNPSVDGTPPVEPEADVPDEGTWTPPKKSSGGCAAGSGTPTLPCAMLLIGVAGARAMRRRRRHD